MTGSPSGDWRKKISPSKSPSSAAWKARKPTNLSSSQSRTRLKLASWAIFTLLLIGAATILSLQPAERVPLLAISVTNYQSPIPPNSFAEEDLERLHDTLDDYRNVNVICETNPPDAKNDFLDLVRARLRDVSLGGPGDDTAIIYISAHGVVNENGQPCLLIGSSNPLNSTTWLSVTELISTIQQVDEVATANKLLVFDASRVGANWTLGQIYNGFTDALPNAIDVAGAQNLAVINSASPGQTGSVSLSLGGSLFGFSFADAMRGAAEVRRGQFDVNQLHDFLRKSVGSHANAAGLEPQIPLLVTPETNFPVAFAAGYQRPTTTTTDVSNHMLLIDNLWEEHRELKRTGNIQSYLDHPLKWAKLEQNLLRLEELVLAGAAYEDEVESTRIEAESIIRALRDANVASPFPGSSLAVANRLTPIATDDHEAVATRWQSWTQSKEEEPITTTPPSPAEDSSVSTDTDDSGEEDQAPLDYHAAANFVWQKLVSDAKTDPNGSSDKEAIDTAISFLEENCIQPSIEFSEIQFLRIVQTWSELGAYVAIQPLLNSLASVETLCVPQDIRTHYWLEVSSRSVQNNIRLSFDDLLVGSSKSLARAKKTLENDAIDQEGRSLSTLAADSRLISDSYQLRDRIFSELPYYAQWSLSMDGFREANGLFRSVQSLVEETTKLAAILDQLSDPTTSDGVKRLQPQFDSTERNLRELEGVIGGRIIELETSGNDRKARVGLPDALRLPDLSKRALLRNMRVEQLSGQVGSRLDEVAAPEDDNDYVDWLANASSAALAVLTGKTEGEDSTNRSRIANVNRLAKLGGQIRSHLAKSDAIEALERQSRERLSAAESPVRSCRAGLSAADQMCRRTVSYASAHPWIGRSSCPSGDLRSIDYQAWILWQGRRRLVDFYGPSDAQSSGGLFAFDATREHIRAASMVGEETTAYQRQLMDKLDQTKTALREWKPIQTIDAVRLPDERRVTHEIRFQPFRTLPRGRVAVYVASQNQTIDLGEQASNRVIRRRAADMRNGQLLKHALIEPDTYSDFDAVALFRGHLVSVPFLGKENNGQVVRVVHRQIPQASIRVRGRDAGATQIVFVLDCSGSMNDPLPSRRKKMTVARSVLADIVRTLPINEAKFQVTLLAYGRNSHWNYNEQADTIRDQAKSALSIELSRPTTATPW